jgi:hypothetical protein
LNPGPALAFLKQGQGLAEQRLGIERGIEARLAPQGQRRRGDLAELALHITRRRHDPAQRIGRQILAISVAARIGQALAAHDVPTSRRKNW